MIRLNATWRFIAVAGVASIALAACGSSSGGGTSSSSSAAASTGTPLYLVDGNIGTGPIKALPAGTMTGTKATQPGAQVSDAFKQQLNKINPKLPSLGYAYGPETYDAMILVALAATEAQSDAGRDIAKHMLDVSQDGTACTTFADCAKLLKQGTNIDYNGQSGPVTFDVWGDPTQATIGVFKYNNKNSIPGFDAPADPTNYPITYTQGTITAPAGTPAPLTKVVNAGAADNVLTYGGLLPITGSLSSLYPPEGAAAKLAVQDINAAGGVLGKPVVWIPGDSGDTSTDTAQVTIQRELKQNVDAVIGAASSSSTLSVADKVTGAGVIQVSNAATSPELTVFPDGGLLWRTSPSDVLQGRVLASTILNDGYQNVGIIARQDSYGEGLAKYAGQYLTQGGGKVVGGVQFYDPNGATSYSAQVSAVKAAGPEAIILIGFDESGKIIQEMVKQGVGPNS
jgi:ABC-type branched-subunit amino acid transport system substrate-binding protein